MPKHVFPAKDVPFGGLENIPLHLMVNPQKTSQKWAGLGILQPYRRSSKMAIYRSPIKIFAPNFTVRLTTRDIMEKCKISSKGIAKASHDLLLEFLGPFPYLRNG